MDLETEPKYKTLLSNIGDGVIATDRDGKVIFMNGAAEVALGWKSAEFLGKKIEEVLSLCNEAGVAVSIQDRPFEIALTTGGFITTAAITTASAIYFYQRKDGTKFPVAFTVTAIILNKEVIGTIEVFRNITKEIEFEKASAVTQKQIMEAKEKDEAMFASIENGLIAIDDQGYAVAMNKVAETLLGWHLDEIINRNLSEIVLLIDEQGIPVPKERRPMDIALTTGKIIETSAITTATYFYVRKDGTKFPVGLAVAPIIFEGKIIGAINNFRDITKEKEVSVAKNEFISLASHQLQSPITSIKWSLEWLIGGHEGVLNEKQKETLNGIYESSKEMSELVGSFLQVTRMESSEFAIEKEDVDLLQISDSVLQELASQISSKKTIIVKKYGADVPHLTIGGKTARVILQNLLSNAIKYTPEGGTVEVSIGKTTEGVSITVKDNGYGIPEDAKGKIFTKLFRADNIKGKEPSGTGLGLYLLKLLVDKLGGKVWFESKEGAGSTFYVNLSTSPRDKDNSSIIPAVNR
jgi:PAS domain S-box-containing protein